MAEVMMTLGGYQFGLNSAAFQELNRNTEWRWPSQDVFEERPALQFTGPGEDSITLPGVIFPEYWGGTGQLDTLRALADKGKPQTMIDGRGNVMGEWVITGVQERQSVFAAAGVGRRQEFTISLKRYSDSGVAVIASVSSAVAAGVGAVTATQQTSRVIESAARKAEQAIATMTSAAASVQGIVSSVVTPMQSTLNAINSVSSAARAVQKAASDAQKRLGSVTSLSSAQAALGGLMRAAGDATQTAAKASRTISQTQQAMQAASDPAASVGVVKSAMVDVNRFAVAATSIRVQTEAIVRQFT